MEIFKSPQWDVIFHPYTDRKVSLRSVQTVRIVKPYKPLARHIWRGNILSPVNEMQFSVRIRTDNCVSVRIVRLFFFQTVSVCLYWTRLSEIGLGHEGPPDYKSAPLITRPRRPPMSPWCRDSIVYWLKGVFFVRQQGIYRVSLEKLQDASEPGNENGSQEMEDITTLEDEDTGESLKERKVGISVGKEKESLPQSTQEVLQQNKLVFHDVNTVSHSSMCILHVMYQTRGRVFPLISKHQEVGWKNEAQPIEFSLTNFEVFGNRRKHSFKCLI